MALAKFRYHPTFRGQLPLRQEEGELAGDLEVAQAQEPADHRALSPGYRPKVPGDYAAVGGKCIVSTE